MYLAGKMILRKRQREEMGSNSLAAHFRVLNGQEKLVDPEALSWVPGNSEQSSLENVMRENEPWQSFL